MKLGDLGERRILHDILEARYQDQAIGDDCAVVRFEEPTTIVMTTDPCPPPMAEKVGYSGLYNHGWLLATINLSDLAAMGAQPTGLLTSLILPRDTSVDEFIALLDGVDDCIRPYGAKVIGGNIKEDRNLSLSATAIGVCQYPPLSRSGAHVGDLVFIIGDLGRFWAGVLAFDHELIGTEGISSLILDNVTRPRPKVFEGMVCARLGWITSLLDSSDGLYPSLAELANKSNVTIELSLDDLPFDEDVMKVASHLSIDPVRLMLGWGDWVLVGTVREPQLRGLEKEIQAVGGKINVIGKVMAKKTSPIVAHYKGQTGSLMQLDSERFAADSWFTAGLSGYLNRLINDPVIML